MSKRKVCVVVTARTSYTKIKPILYALKEKKNIEIQIVCAASAVLNKYGEVDKIIEKDGFKVNERVFMIIESESLLTTAKTAGMGIIEFSGAFNRLDPDLVLVMADRYEVLSAAIAASYQNIPLAHVQGGEISGNIDEKVRHAITKLADIHFPATKRARDIIIQLGEEPSKVFLTGCPSTDITEQIVQNGELDFKFYDKYSVVGSEPILDDNFIIVMQHPDTTEYSKSRSQVTETLKAVHHSGKNAIWFWPNSDAGSDELSKGIRSYRENFDPENIGFIKNMEPNDFLKLLYMSNGILGNSSVGIRECSYLGIPSVNIGNRQNNRERGPNVLDVEEFESSKIKNAIHTHLKGRIEKSELYGNGDAGKRIADILSKVPYSYTKSLQIHI